MSISDTTIERIKALVVSQCKDQVSPTRMSSQGWPIIRQNLALFEFIRVRRVQLSSARAALDLDLQRPKFDTRGMWARQLVKGFELLADSAEVYLAEFGDPFHPEGIPPNPPGHGRLYYVDPFRERAFVTSGKVGLPDAGSFRTEIVAGERQELSTIEPELRNLALRAAPEFPDLRLIEIPGTWPAMLVGEEIVEVNTVELVERRFVEMFLQDVEHRIRVDPEFARSASSASERELYTRLLQAGPIYRAWYNQPPHYGSPGFVIWLAPKVQYALARHWGWAVLRKKDPDSVCCVLPYGARDAATLDRFATIELEAAQQADRQHYQELIAKRPAIKGFLDRLEAEGYECWQCHERTRRMRWVTFDSEGRSRFRCQGCGARVLLEGPLESPPKDLRREKQISVRWTCSSCQKEASSFRAIRSAPGEAWLAVCPECGCTSAY